MAQTTSYVQVASGSELLLCMHAGDNLNKLYVMPDECDVHILTLPDNILSLPANHSPNSHQQNLGLTWMVLEYWGKSKRISSV